MISLNADQVAGDIFKLKVTDPRHFGGEAKAPSKDFGSLLMQGLNDVNSSQKAYEQLSVQAITDPDSVDPHDITIAGAEANLSLNIAKNVIDRVIRAYRDITSLR